MNAVNMTGNQVEDSVAYIFVIAIAVKILNIQTIFEAMMLVVIHRHSSRKRAYHAYTGQHEIAGSGGAEVEVAGLVEKDICTVCHNVTIIIESYSLLSKKLVQ